jgi:uncharacterized phage protein gp47/JayE
MAKFVPKIYPDILQRMINRTVARSQLSDLTDSSTFKHVLGATAREVDDAYYQMNNKLDVSSVDRASGDDLDRRAEDYIAAVPPRIQAVAATGTLVFSRTTINPGPVINIPIGYEVEVPGEAEPIIAATTVAGTIGVGNTESAPVATVVVDAGTRGNVGANVLTKFKSGPPTGVEAVTNPTAYVGGLDRETDDAFRQRIKDGVLSLARCTPNALEVAARTASLPSGQTVIFARTVEDPISLGNVTLYVDDGTGVAESTANNTGVPEILTSGPEFPSDQAVGGEVFLYTDNFPVKDTLTIIVVKTPGPTTLVRDDPGANGYTLNPASGQIFLNTALILGDAVTIEYTWFTGIVAETQKIIDGDAGDRVNYPGHRAAGVLVQVLTPAVTNVTVELATVVLNGFVRADVIELVRTQVAAYINGLGIGNDVIVSEIIERAMSVAGMFDVTVIQPLGNIAILDNQLARVNDAAIDIVIG